MLDHPYRKSALSENATGSSQATSLAPSERDAPARPAQKWSLASDFTSPMISKKKRIPHQPSHVQPVAGGHFSFSVLPFMSLLTLNMSPCVGSISPYTCEVQQKDKFQSSSIPESARVQEISNSNGKRNELRRLKQLRPLDFDEGKREDTSIASTCSATNDQPDYLRKYVATVSLKQRQCCKDDFNAEYEEYWNLHSHIDKVKENFRQFHEQWKSLTSGSKAYQMLLCRILADYQQIQQGSPSYSEMKSRCQYLYKKLSHIQSCISEFDKQRVEPWHKTSASA